jgi:hypothetical protein
MRFRVAGEAFDLDRSIVERSLRHHLPDPLVEHYVVVSGRRWPPKQVLSCVTGLDRADFTTHQARRILKRLGFVAARTERRSADPSERDRGDADGRPQHGQQAEALEAYAGQWVALAGPTEVLVGADDPHEVLAWLSRHNRRASGMFRVPSTAAEAEGAAPE